jgi:hypothetical protein
MASETDICNRALQKLGAKRITSLEQDSVNARACNASYESLRDAELRAHPWSFATTRTSLAADSDAPEWGRANAFQLPSDFLCLLPVYPEDNSLDTDWIIEGQKIYTDDDDPLYVRYTRRETDPNVFDSLFREALASRIALELCEELTQSNTKKADLRVDYKDSIREARRTNAIEKIAAEPPEDSWITARRS